MEQLQSEQPINHETPNQGDVVTASLFKTAFALERDREMTSGMMYQVDETRLMNAFDGLMSCDSAQTSLNQEERSAVENQMRNIFVALDTFKNEQMRYRYGTSHAGGYVGSWSPDQVCHFSPSTEADPTPTADMYLRENGELQYKMTYDQQVLRKYGGGITPEKSGELTGVIEKIEPLSPDIIAKLATVIKSDSFSNKWDELESSLTYSPQKKLSQVINLEAIA
jgi:hypothetical protein